MNITMGKVDFILSPAVDNKETLKKITPSLIEYYAKGQSIGLKILKADLAARETALIEKLNGIIIPKISEARTIKEILEQTEEVNNIYPESKEVVNGIRDSFGNGGTVPGIQALGIIGVMVIIFLVGVAQGASNKKKQNPE